MSQTAQASLVPEKQTPNRKRGTDIAWGEVAIGDICHLVNGRAFKPTDWTDVGLPIIRIQNLNDESKPFNYYKGTFDPKHEINDGDVLISWSGTPGTSFGAFIWTRGRAVLNQHIFRAELNGDRIDKKFFVHSVNWRLEELIRRAHGGVGLRHITKSELEAVTLRFPCPYDPVRSLDIQRCIVAQIETLLAEVKEARALAAALRRDTDHVMNAALAEVISELPTGRRPLLEVLEGKPRNGWSPQCDNDPAGTPVLKLGAVLGFRFNPSAVKRTSLPVDSRAHYWLTKGDILISRSNTPDLVGHAAVYSGDPHPCIYPDLLMKMRARLAEADSQFVVYWLQGKEARVYVRTHASGASSTMKKITQGDVCSLPFPKITIEEQRRVTAYLDAL